MAFDINEFLTQIFGTGDPTVSGGGTTVQYADLLNPNQQGLLDDLVNLVRGGGVGVDVAGASPLQGLGFAGLGGIVENPNIVNSFNQSRDTISDLLQPFDPASTTNFFEKSVRDPALRIFEQDIIPQIQESFAGMNAGQSSGLNRALARAGGNLTSDLSSQLNQLLFSTEQQNNVNRLNALPLAQQFRQQPIDYFSNLIGAGGIQRGIEQEQLAGQYISPFERFLAPALQTQGQFPIVNRSPFVVGTEGLLPF